MGAPSAARGRRFYLGGVISVPALGEETVASPVEVRALIDEQLMPRVGEISERIVAAIQGHLDPGGDADPEWPADTLASVEANVRVQLTAWAAGQDPTDAHPPEPAIAYARLYAREGRELSTLLRAYRVGQEELLRILRHELEALLPAERLIDAIDAVSALVFTYNDAVLAHLERVFEEEREACRQNAVALRRQTIAAIFGGAEVDPAEASRQLGYDLNRRHLGAVLWDADEADLLAAADRIGEQLGAGRHLAHPLGSHSLAVWFGTWSELDPAAIVPPAGVRCATGRAGAGYAGFRATHLEARQAQRIASTCAIDDAHVEHARVALAGVLCADPEAARAFARAELGPLLEGKRPDALARLRETLGVYFEELASVSRTARRLGVHENTVQYRLHGAADLLERPLDERPLELQAALAIARFFPDLQEPDPTPEDPR